LRTLRETFTFAGNFKFNIMTENELSFKIIGVALKVHTKLGPGLLESVYEQVLTYELRQLGLEVKTQIGVPFKYDDIVFECGFRLDILVENKIVIEVKSVENLASVHHKQLLTYLKLTDKKLGLLINFNVALLKDHIVRIVNGL